MEQDKALIIMDMQNDFCDGGPIPHIGSLEIIPKINKIREDFQHVYLIRELHQENHSSFKEQGGKLPSHCIENTFGCELNHHLDIKKNDIIISRGTLQKFDSNSAFYVAEDINKETNLRHLLKINNIKELYFCGIGMDVGIFSTILDAINFQYNCHIYTDCIAFLDEVKCKKNLQYLESLNVELMVGK